MEINPNRPIQGLNRSEKKKRSEKSGKSGAYSEAPAGNTEGVSSSGLHEELQGIPGIRQGQIDTGRRLAGDPDYPDDRELRDLGELIYLNYEETHPRHGK